MALGSGITSLLSSCSTVKVLSYKQESDKIEVPLNNFEAEQKLLQIRPMWMDYDILLYKKDPDNYTAIYLCCSHQQQPLVATQHGLYCNSHGSKFGFDGLPKKEPAVKPLKMFKTKLLEDKVEIYLK